MASTHQIDPAHDGGEPVPLGQRLYDNMFLLLILGNIIMLVVFTGWGLWELLTMPMGTLP